MGDESVRGRRPETEGERSSGFVTGRNCGDERWLIADAGTGWAC